MRTQARSRRLWAALWFFPFALIIAGCGGSSVGTVSGTVSYKKQLLKGGNVSIIPKAGEPRSSSIAEDGSYKISKVPIGPAKITVETKSLRPVSQKSLPGPYARAPKDVLPQGVQGDAKRYVAIPDKYADPEGSGLSLEVKRGDQTHNIDLN